MKNYGFAALLFVLAYIAMFLSGVFNGSAIDPLEPGFGRLVVFVVWLLLVFATGIFIAARKEKKWYTGLSVFILVIIWLVIVSAVGISCIDFLGPDFRF